MIRATGAAAGAALVLALTLTACSGSDDGAQPETVQTAAGGTEFNQADVDFATRMVPHHAQAVEMVVMAQGRDLSGPVVQLMEEIRQAQVAEVEMMVDWLTAWDEPVPETSLDHANAEHSSGDEDADGDTEMSGMSGMMTGAQMSELGSTDDDAEFQRLWLEMMAEHHAGAIEMARAEINNGHNREVVALAEDVVEAQTAEIETIKALQ